MSVLYMFLWIPNSNYVFNMKQTRCPTLSSGFITAVDENWHFCSAHDNAFSLRNPVIVSLFSKQLNWNWKNLLLAFNKIAAPRKDVWGDRKKDEYLSFSLAARHNPESLHCRDHPRMAIMIIQLLITFTYMWAPERKGLNACIPPHAWRAN